MDASTHAVSHSPIRALLLGCTVGLSLLGTGCGPVVAGVQIVKADIELNAAEGAGATQHAIYEYTAASEYLHKAREEHGYSDFSAAREYADRALDYAQKARKRAEQSSRAEQPAVLPEPEP